MEEQFLEEILKDTYSLGSFKKRVMALKLKIEKKIFRTSDDKEAQDDSVKEKDTTQLSEAERWVLGIDSKILEDITPDNFKEVFERIEKFISEATSLSIYFVFIPEQDQLKGVGEWLRKVLKNPKLIFDVKIDPSLIGGCAFAYKGVYKDYSLRAKISENKEKLMEEFRGYLKN